MTDEEMKEIEEQTLKDATYFFFLEAFNSCSVGTAFMCEMEGIPHKRRPLYTADDWVEGCRKMRKKGKK